MIISGCFRLLSRRGGRVAPITDGDTIKILASVERQIKVRLAEIDTPGKSQLYGTKAKQVLSDKIYRKQVTVVKVATDRYINAEIVADGAAWVYRKYSKDPNLLELEFQAREEVRGLWALQEDQRVAPWEWRKRSRGLSQ
jgi:endonuclease YncB( thermonuclease family)